MLYRSKTMPLACGHPKPQAALPSHLPALRALAVATPLVWQLSLWVLWGEWRHLALCSLPLLHLMEALLLCLLLFKLFWLYHKTLPGSSPQVTGSYLSVTQCCSLDPGCLLAACVEATSPTAGSTELWTLPPHAAAGAAACPLLHTHSAEPAAATGASPGWPWNIPQSCLSALAPAPHAAMPFREGP